MLSPLNRSQDIRLIPIPANWKVSIIILFIHLPVTSDSFWIFMYLFMTCSRLQGYKCEQDRQAYKIIIIKKCIVTIFRRKIKGIRFSLAWGFNMIQGIGKSPGQEIMSMCRFLGSTGIIRDVAEM